MEDTKAELINLIAYLIINFLLAGVQSSLWPQFFGGFPPPFFLAYSLVFFSIYHNTKWSSFFLIGSVFLLSSFSLIPIESIIVLLALCYLGVAQLRKRIFWSGFSYFIVCSFLCSFLFLFGYYIMAWLWETDKARMASFQFSNFVLQIINTSLLAPAFYWLFMRLEILTRGFEESSTGENG